MNRHSPTFKYFIAWITTSLFQVIKVFCWVLALIFHIGCYIKDFRSTILNISQKMSSSDIYDLPKSLGTSLSPPPPIILPNPQVQGHSSPIGNARSRCDHILETKSHIDKPGELGVKVLRKLVVQSVSKSHSEFLWDSYETDYHKTLNDLNHLLR